MQTIIWEVSFPSPPELLRRCRRCGRTTSFRSSGLFRVNAQQKNLDVWLIYHCGECNASWNMTVLSRVSSRQMNPQRLEQYIENDPALAMECAMNMELIRKNEVQACPIDHETHGWLPVFPLEEPVRILIRSPYDVPVKVTDILREKLGLSGSTLKWMAKSGQLSMEGGADPLKRRLRRQECCICIKPVIELERH